MNLLPKSHKEFGEKDYWNQFFKNRGNKAFEWYGEYLELCSHLHKYIKPKDVILIPGCGNSSLSADLYDAGFHNITNIDVSEVVIKQMQRINAQRQSMKFIYMDALNTTFSNEEFSVVLDKGTLDALMPDDSAETNERIDKYFAEIKRVLRLGGRFVCISLLQSHILSKLLAVFCDKSWMFRVVRCHEAEQKNAENGDGTTLPVFVVVVTKFKELPQMILEVCLAGDKMIRLQTVEELRECVKSAQDTAFITNGLARTTLGDDEKEVTLDLMQPGEDTPRYSLYVVDQRRAQANSKYAVFIVPQGRESDWLFGTPAGRKQLQDSARISRLVVAILCRGQEFSSLEMVKSELADAAKMLTPPGFAGQIPFLSLGSELGHRTLVHRGTSPYSGEYVIEDVSVDGATHRRLIFLSNQFLVQSEARLVEKPKTKKQHIDYGHVSLYHTFMTVGLQMSCARSGPTVLQSCTKSDPTAAILGLGGGSLCMFTRRCFSKLKVTAVDIDPAMLDIAKEHFGLRLDENLDVQIKDGVDFLKESASGDARYDAILYDMDNKDRSVGLSCPPKQFLEDEVLQYVKRILSDDGQFIINLVCRDNELHDSILANLKRHFKHLATVKLFEDVNEIVFATNKDENYTPTAFEEAVKKLNATARERNLVKIKCVDLKDFLQSVTVVS